MENSTQKETIICCQGQRTKTVQNQKLRTYTRSGQLQVTSAGLDLKIKFSGDFICGGEREEISENLHLEQHKQRSDEAVCLNKDFVTSIWPELENCQISRTWTGLMPWFGVESLNFST